MKKTKRAKRCEICKKLLRDFNKSGLCTYHRNYVRSKEKRNKEKKVSLKN